jgi:hypothetical protein
MNITESEADQMIEDFENGKLKSFKFNINSSWSGEEAKESFVNEWNKGVEVVFYLKSGIEFFKKIIEQDLDKCDAGIEDILLYDEYRNIIELELEIIDISDGREDVGYIEIELSIN